MKERNLRIHYTYRPAPFEQYYYAYVLDEDDNLVWMGEQTNDPTHIKVLNCMKEDKVITDKEYKEIVTNIREVNLQEDF